MPVPKTWDSIGQNDVKIISIDPQPTKLYEDQYGNQIAYWEISDQSEKKYSISFSIDLEPSGKIEIDDPGIYDPSSPEYSMFTGPSTNIPSNDIKISQLAQQIIGEEKNSFEQAKLLKNWVSTQLTQGGSTNEVLSIIESKKFFDCYGPSITLISLIRSIGIPARLVGGYLNYRDRYFSEGLYQWPDEPFGIHVWAEFFIPNYGWYQVEPQNPFYFGINEERIVLFRGEDIELESGYPLLNHFHMPHINYPPQQYGDNLSLNVKILQ